MVVYLIIGVILILFAILAFSQKRRDRSANGRNFSDKILVDLDQCEFRTDERREEFQPYTNIPLINVDKIGRVTHEYATYVTYVADGRRFFGGPFDKSIEGIKLAFLRQKFTYIYYVKSDADNYFFDLEFLKNED